MKGKIMFKHINDEKIHVSKLLPASVLMIAPAGTVGMLAIISKTGKNHLITSLFLSLLICLIYVIALYIVVSKMQEKTEKKSSNKTLALIYVTRYSIRLLILMYVASRACRVLMLNGYSSGIILIPVIFTGIIMGIRGLHAALDFYQAIFIAAIILFIFIGLSGIENLSLSRVTDLISWELPEGFATSVCSVMKRGYLFFLAFSMIEFVVFIYAMVRRRKRSMLIKSSVTSIVIALVGCVFVVGLLGIASLESGRRNILHLVGALKLPFSDISHLGLPVCMIFVISLVCLVGIHFVFAGEMTRFAWKNVKIIPFMFIYGIGLLVIYPLFEGFASRVGIYRLTAGYMGMIDIPLSIIAPVFASKTKLKLKDGAAMVIGAVFAIILTGCGSVPLEDVDYLTVIAINQNQGQMEYTFVMDAVSGGDAEEKVESYTADSLEEAIEAYDKEHVKPLDDSHTEYIISPDMETYMMASAELNQRFAVTYLEVIIDAELTYGIKDMEEDNIRKYIEGHYEGECMGVMEVR